MSAATGLKFTEFCISDIAKAVYTKPNNTASEYMKFLEADTILKNYWTKQLLNSNKEVDVLV